MEQPEKPLGQAFGRSGLTSAKIVATPTSTTWSQAYHAGNLFAVLSLASKEEIPSIDIANKGKEILDILEQEFFTLEIKDLSTIREAVLTTCDNIPDNLSVSFLVCAIQQGDTTVLYSYQFGKGSIILKREDKIGSILSGPSENEPLTTSSGFLQNGDVIVLQTQAFSQTISLETLYDALDKNPLEAAEELTPKILELENGQASALIVTYNRVAPIDAPEASLSIPQQDQAPTNGYMQEEVETQESDQIENPFVEPSQKESPAKNIFSSLPHSKRLLLTIALVLLIILGVSIFLVVKSKQDAKTKAAFNDVMQKAEEKYTEGESLLSLNKNLARDDFEQAKKILIEGKSKFQKDSKEEKAVSELLAKVESNISSTANSNFVQAKSVDFSASPLLMSLKDKGKNVYAAQDGKTVYVANSSGISQVTSSKETIIIKNENTWDSIGGLGGYLSNVYLLDKKAGVIFKFVKAGSSYGKSNYLPKANSDLSNANALAIDGSLYVLLSDGTIKKFTKGSQETFQVSGLPKAFSNPTRIYTNADINSIYVLDPANSRIVVLDKNGAYQAQYQSDVIKKAVDFDVLEKDKKAYVLADQKLYEVPLK